jgi:hypothetical protein
MHLDKSHRLELHPHFGNMLTQGATFIVCLFICILKTTYATPPHTAATFDQEWFRKRCLESPEFEEAANQLLSDAQTFEKIKPKLYSMPRSHIRNSAIAAISTGLAIAATCILPSHE